MTGDSPPWRRIARAVLLCVVVPGAVWGASPVPGGAMVAAHNAVRAEHRLPPLSWSEALSEAAQWADVLALERGCTMEHSRTGQGENLYWASPAIWSDGRREPQVVTPQAVVADWAAERADYDYATNRCRAGQSCGHFTQIVWRSTTAVGCAMSRCRDHGQIWVCRYEPAGNRVGQRPW